MQYLVIWRDEDKPEMSLMSKEDFEGDVWKESFENHTYLDKLPSLMEFPANSVFIIEGNIVKK